MSNFAVEIFVLTFLSVLPSASVRPNCITKFSFCQELFFDKKLSTYPQYPQPVDKSIENYSQVKFDKSRNRFSVATYSQLVNFSIFYFCVSVSFQVVYVPISFGTNISDCSLLMCLVIVSEVLSVLHLNYCANWFVSVLLVKKRELHLYHFTNSLIFILLQYQIQVGKSSDFPNFFYLFSSNLSLCVF